MKNTQIINYLNKTLKNKNKFNVKEIKGDASKRKYYRVEYNEKSYIVDSRQEKRNFKIL